MNIRGTDPTALSAVTDLFVTPSQSRDNNSPDFQRALSPPKPSAPPAQSTVPSSAPLRETAKRDTSPKPTAPADPCQKSEQHEHEDANDATVADDVTEQPIAEADEAKTADTTGALVAEESPKTGKESATALAVATTVAAEQKLPEQKIPQVDAVLKEAPATEEAVPSEDVVKAVVDPQSTMKAVPIANTSEGPLTIAPLATAEVAGETAVEQALVATTDVAAEATTPESSEKPAGIGVLPSALEAQGAKAAVKANAPRATTTRTATKVDDKSKSVKETESTTSTQSPDASADTSGATMVAPAINSEDKPEHGNKQIDQPAVALPTMQQPSEQTTAIELKADSATPPPPDVPAVSDLPSAQQQTQDSAKPSTSQPLANQAITQRLPAHAVMRSTPQQPTPPPLHVDAARFLQRVAKAFEVAQERGGEIRLRLSPPELGALRVEVNLSENGLAARVEVENNDARTILLENLPALRERLSEQGLKLEKFDVELSQREPDQQANREFFEQQRDRQAPRETRSVRTPIVATQTPATNTPATATSGWQDRQLNVIV